MPRKKSINNNWIFECEVSSKHLPLIHKYMKHNKIEPIIAYNYDKINKVAILDNAFIILPLDFDMKYHGEYIDSGFRTNEEKDFIINNWNIYKITNLKNLCTKDGKLLSNFPKKLNNDKNHLEMDTYLQFYNIDVFLTKDMLDEKLYIIDTISNLSKEEMSNIKAFEKQYFFKQKTEKNDKDISNIDLIIMASVEGISYNKDITLIKSFQNLEFIEIENCIFYPLDVNYPNLVKNNIIENHGFIKKEILFKLQSYLLSKQISSDDFTKKYINYASSHYLNKKKDLDKKINILQSKLFIASNILGEVNTKLKFIKTGYQDTIKQQISNITNINDLSEVKFTNYGMFFKTKELYICHNNINTYCGIFEIQLHLFDRKGAKFRNIASPCFSKSNPHGTCFGTFRNSMESCLAQLDYYTFTLTLLKMLKTINSEDSLALSVYKKYFNKTNKPDETFFIENFTPIFYDAKNSSINEDDLDDEY